MKFAPMKPTPKGLFRRTPPAVFPAMLGLLGLALAWRRGVAQFALPPALAEMFVGAVTLLVAFVVLAYLAKIARRPGAALEDLRILPGRAGLAAGVLCLYLMAAAVQPNWGGAVWLFWLGVAAHLALSAAVLWTFATGPAEQRRVNPVWQLTFTGWIVAAMVAQMFLMWALALMLFWVSLVSAVTMWALSIRQFQTERVHEPLRPLLEIHLAPAAVLGTVAAGFGAAGFGATTVTWALAALAAGYLLVLVVFARWLLRGGFSPLWGALTFPLAATASCWLAVGGGWALPGALMLIAATLIVLPIAFRVLKLWAKGELAVRTNAAIA